MTEEELFDLVRKNYGEANIDYLKEQVKSALKEPTLSKEETLNGFLDWVVIAGCGNVNDYYRPFIYNAISYLLRPEPAETTET